MNDHDFDGLSLFSWVFGIIAVLSVTSIIIDNGGGLAIIFAIIVFIGLGISAKIEEHRKNKDDK